MQGSTLISRTSKASYRSNRSITTHPLDCFEAFNSEIVHRMMIQLMNEKGGSFLNNIIMSSIVLIIWFQTHLFLPISLLHLLQITLTFLPRRYSLRVPNTHTHHLLSMPKRPHCHHFLIYQRQQLVLNLHSHINVHLVNSFQVAHAYSPSTF